MAPRKTDRNPHNISAYSHTQEQKRFLPALEVFFARLSPRGFKQDSQSSLRQACKFFYSGVKLGLRAAALSNGRKIIRKWPRSRYSGQWINFYRSRETRMYSTAAYIPAEVCVASCVTQIGNRANSICDRISNINIYSMAKYEMSCVTPPIFGGPRLEIISPTATHMPEKARTPI